MQKFTSAKVLIPLGFLNIDVQIYKNRHFAFNVHGELAFNVHRRYAFNVHSDLHFNLL